MTSCVIDASVVLKWYLPEEFREASRRLLVSARAGDLTVHVPDLIYCDAASILWRHVRGGELTREEAGLIATALLEAPKTVHSSSLLTPSALETACESGRSAYDCFYLALAEVLGTQLITADIKLVNALARTRWEGAVVPIHAL